MWEKFKSSFSLAGVAFSEVSESIGTLAVSILVSLFILWLSWGHPAFSLRNWFEFLNEQYKLFDVAAIIIPLGWLYVSEAFVFVSRGNRPESVRAWLFYSLSFWLPSFVNFGGSLILSFVILQLRGNSVDGTLSTIVESAIIACPTSVFFLQGYMALARAAERRNLSALIPGARVRP